MMQPTTTIHMPELYGRSYLLRFVYEGLGRVLTVKGACLLWVVVPAGLFAVLCWRQGTLFPEDMTDGISLLHDTTALSYYFLLPVCFLLLYYSLRRFRRYLNRLPEVLEPACLSEAHGKTMDIARNAFQPAGMRNVRLLFVVIGLMIFGYNTVTNFFPDVFYKRAQKWNAIEFPVSFAADRLYVLFVWGYAIPVWASEVCMQLAVMVRLSRRMAQEGWLRISPYARDRFGGLSRLRAAASGVGYLILAAGLFFLAPLLRSVLWGLPLHVGNYIGLGVYVLLASVGALLPVYLLHRILARKKHEMLAFFAGAFDSINSRVMTLVKENNIKGLGEEELGRALEAVDRLYVQWSALPVWPGNVLFFVKILVTVISPVAAFLGHQLTSVVPL